MDDLGDRPEMAALERRLEAARPVPRAGFRAELRQELLQRAPMRPPRLRLLIAAYAGSGSALLLIAAIGIAGAGPLAS